MLQGHTDNVGGLAFSADGSALATACDDRVIRLFKLTDVRAKNMGFMKHNMTTTPVDVAFGSASNLIAVTARGKTSSGVFYVHQISQIGDFACKVPPNQPRLQACQDSLCCETAQRCGRVAFRCLTIGSI